MISIDADAVLILDIDMLLPKLIFQFGLCSKYRQYMGGIKFVRVLINKVGREQVDNWWSNLRWHI